MKVHYSGTIEIDDEDFARKVKEEGWEQAKEHLFIYVSDRVRDEAGEGYVKYQIEF
jgi:hypothetical protein